VAGANVRADETRVILSANLERIFPVLSPDETLRDTDLVFEKRLIELKDANPDAILADAGRALSISYTTETGYNVPVWQIMDFNKYHVANLDARETVTATDDIFGLHVAPDSFRDRAIVGFQGTRPAPLGLPSTRIVKTSKGVELSFHSLSSIEAARGMGDRLSVFESRPTSELLAEIAASNDAGRITIAFASGPQFVPAFDLAEQTPDLLVVFDEAPGLRENPIGFAGKWRIGAPPTGELHLLRFTANEGKLVEQPGVDRVSYLDEARRKDLIAYPLGRIGLGIQNLEHVLQQFFNMERGAASLDRFPITGLEDLTSIAPSVYTIPYNGSTARVYRVQSQIPYYRYNAPIDPSWPPMDMLVLVDGDHRFERVISRVEFPIGGSNTTMLEAINRMRGRAIDEWEADPRLAAGLPEVWGWAKSTIGQVIEMDRRLFGKREAP
jgi:hypothetical protein